MTRVTPQMRSASTSAPEKGSFARPPALDTAPPVIVGADVAVGAVWLREVGPAAEGVDNVAAPYGSACVTWATTTVPRPLALTARTRMDGFVDPILRPSMRQAPGPE